MKKSILKSIFFYFFLGLSILNTIFLFNILVKNLKEEKINNLLQEKEKLQEELNSKIEEEIIKKYNSSNENIKAVYIIDLGKRDNYHHYKVEVIYSDLKNTYQEFYLVTIYNEKIEIRKVRGSLDGELY